MKAQLKEITEQMSQQEQIDIINKNFETINQLQHDREMAIFNRFNQLNSKIDNVDVKLSNKLDSIINHLSGKKLLIE